MNEYSFGMEFRVIFILRISKYILCSSLKIGIVRIQYIVLYLSLMCSYFMREISAYNVFQFSGRFPNEVL